jgi:exodeoxyribonuclease VII large subunit
LRLAARHPRQRLAALAQRQQHARLRLRAALRQGLDASRMRLTRLHAALRVAEPARRLARDGERLAALHARLRRAEVQRLQQHTLHLRGLARTLSTISPLATVARGYSLLQREDGHVVRRMADTRIGQRLRARVGDGELALEVLGLHPGIEPPVPAA